MVAKKASKRVTPKKPTNEGVQAGPTSAIEWKKKSSVGTPIRVPSGNMALVKRPGMQVFLSQGIIPNSLMGFISDALKSGKPQVQDLEINQDTMKDLMRLVDQVTVQCCIEPEVNPVPVDNKDNALLKDYRDPEKLYVDEVDVEDKMFIFNYAVGGTTDVESFREKLTTSMDDLQRS